MSDQLEGEARAHRDAGEHDRAVALVVHGYGDEVFSFLMARLRDEDAAADVFGQACEDLVHSMPTFGWRCSVRTWFYRLARSAAVRYRRSPSNRPDRRVPLSHVSELAVQVRSRTVAHLRTDVKDQVRKLRDQLDDDEQQLLMLRIDRDLSWNEIAEIVSDGDAADELARVSARLRQQFQALKTRLRQLARAEGMLDNG